MVPGVLQGLRHAKAWAAVGAGLVAAVAWLSLTPDPVDAGRIEEVKVGHFLAYAVLALWFSQLVRPGGPRLALGLALVVLGVALEYAQGMTSYRTFAYADMRDNAIGVAFGLLAGLGPGGRLLLALEGAWARRGRSA